jgi:hypothetical protein
MASETKRRASRRNAARKAEAEALATADANRQPLCGSAKADGSPCTSKPWKDGRCKRHQGKPGLMATTAALTEGRPTTPAQAIQGVLSLMCGQLVYINAKVASLEENELWAGQEGERISKWLRWRERTVDRITRIAATATTMGVAEKQADLISAQTQVVATLLERVVSDLDLSAAQKKKLAPSIQRHMTAIDVGGQEVTQ